MRDYSQLNIDTQGIYISLYLCTWFLWEILQVVNEGTHVPFAN